MQAGPLCDFFGYFPKVTEMAELLRLCDMMITPLLSYNVGPFKGFFVLVFFIFELLYINTPERKSDHVEKCQQDNFMQRCDMKCIDPTDC